MTNKQETRVIEPYIEFEFYPVIDFIEGVYVVRKDSDGVNRFIDLKTTKVEIRNV